jgi:hypothetical protein
MKVLCEYSPGGSSFVRSAWGRVFRACGHDFRFWVPETKSAFDAFAEFEPELYIGTTYGLPNAVIKCLKARQGRIRTILFASAWGPWIADLDKAKYPVVVVTDDEKRGVEQVRPDFVFIHAHGKYLEGTMSGWSEIGVPYRGVLNAADLYIYLGGQFRPEFECDIAFVGGRWPYKARNIDRYILPLCEKSKGLRAKVFGNTVWPVGQYLGTVRDEEVKDIFCSALVCPSVSEPHSTDLGWDVIERPFKVLASGGFCVGDFVQEARDLFAEDELPMGRSPEEFEALIHHFIKDRYLAAEIAAKGRAKVLTRHTYHDRVAQFFTDLGMPHEAKTVFQDKERLLRTLPEAAWLQD